MRGTKSCLAHLDRIADSIKKNVPKTITEFVDRRVDIANSMYTSAMYVGPNDVTVQSINDEKTWTIIASGSALLFLEFGTGIHYQRPSEMLELAAQYPAKSWSGSDQGRGYLTDPKKFAKWNGWWPTPPAGMETDGNPAVNAMYETRKQIRDFLPEEVCIELDKAVKS